MENQCRFHNYLSNFNNQSFAKPILIFCIYKQYVDFIIFITEKIYQNSHIQEGISTNFCSMNNVTSLVLCFPSLFLAFLLEFIMFSLWFFLIKLCHDFVRTSFRSLNKIKQHKLLLTSSPGHNQVHSNIFSKCEFLLYTWNFGEPWSFLMILELDYIHEVLISPIKLTIVTVT